MGIFGKIINKFRNKNNEEEKYLKIAREHINKAGENLTKEQINAAMAKAANQSFGYTEEQLVSSDIIGIKFGSLFDATQTMVAELGDDLYQVQVVSWYDNENSYTSQMVRTIKYFAELN